MSILFCIRAFRLITPLLKLPPDVTLWLVDVAVVFMMQIQIETDLITDEKTEMYSSK